MPQFSLYLDEGVHKELEIRARINNISVSKFVVSALKAQFSKGWPDGFQNIFGSVKDESFIRREPSDWESDCPRETL